MAYADHQAPTMYLKIRPKMAYSLQGPIQYFADCLGDPILLVWNELLISSPRISPLRRALMKNTLDLLFGPGRPSC
jgi:hypothetical protein